MLRALLQVVLALSSSGIADIVTTSDATQLIATNNCIIILPSLMIPIFSSNPGLMSQTSANFLVEQDPSQNLVCDCLISFVIPENPGNCQLELSFPDSFQGNAWGATHLYFWNVLGTFDPSCCWNDAPDPADLFGSVLLPGGNVSWALVDSFACQSSVRFRAGMDRTGEAGRCSFEQTSEDGLVLRYCA